MDFVKEIEELTHRCVVAGTSPQLKKDASALHDFVKGAAQRRYDSLTLFVSAVSKMTNRKFADLEVALELFNEYRALGAAIRKALIAVNIYFPSP